MMAIDCIIQIINSSPAPELLIQPQSLSELIKHPIFEEFAFRGPFWLLMILINLQNQICFYSKKLPTYSLLVFVAFFEFFLCLILGYGTILTIAVISNGILCGFLMIRSYLSKKIGLLWLALVLNGILFGLVHILLVFSYGTYATIQAIIMGFLFSWLVIKTRSIWPSILKHGLWNLLVSLMP